VNKRINENVRNHTSFAQTLLVSGNLLIFDRYDLQVKHAEGFFSPLVHFVRVLIQHHLQTEQLSLHHQLL
jgi:hypothetical protein